jgi:hypothetical protein
VTYSIVPFFVGKSAADFFEKKDIGVRNEYFEDVNS